MLIQYHAIYILIVLSGVGVQCVSFKNKLDIHYTETQRPSFPTTSIKRAVEVTNLSRCMCLNCVVCLNCVGCLGCAMCKQEHHKCENLSLCNFFALGLLNFITLL